MDTDLSMLNELQLIDRLYDLENGPAELQAWIEATVQDLHKYGFTKEKSEAWAKQIRTFGEDLRHEVMDEVFDKQDLITLCKWAVDPLNTQLKEFYKKLRPVITNFTEEICGESTSTQSQPKSNVDEESTSTHSQQNSNVDEESTQTVRKLSSLVLDNILYAVHSAKKSAIESEVSQQELPKSLNERIEKYQSTYADQFWSLMLTVESVANDVFNEQQMTEFISRLESPLMETGRKVALEILTRFSDEVDRTLRELTPQKPL